MKIDDTSGEFPMQREPPTTNIFLNGYRFQVYGVIEGLLRGIFTDGNFTPNIEPKNDSGVRFCDGLGSTTSSYSKSRRLNLV